jgi:hypothetical protein
MTKRLRTAAGRVHNETLVLPAIRDPFAAPQETSMNSRLVWPLLLILFGMLLLLDNLGLLPGSAFSYIWPLLLILLGASLLLSRGRQAEVVEDATTLEGARSARLNLKHGAGELSVHGGAPADLLYRGGFAGGVDKQLSRQGDQVNVTLAARPPDWFRWPWPMFSTGGLNWDVGMNETVPLALTVESGASSSRLDLTALRVTELELHTGASSTVIALPARAGRTRAKLSSGAAAVDVTVPTGVAARIRGGIGVGSLDVDQRRFPRRDGAYESPDFMTAENSVELDVEGGVGSVRVR